MLSPGKEGAVAVDKVEVGEFETLDRLCAQRSELLFRHAGEVLEEEFLNRPAAGEIPNHTDEGDDSRRWCAMSPSAPPVRR